MSIAGNIRAYIAKLPFDQIFSTREVLHYGKRSAIDQALYRMVENCTIIRLAWGLFTKNKNGIAIPSIDEIAAAKSKAFCKSNTMHGQDAAFELKLVDSGNERTVYNLPGSSSSSFMCVVQQHRVYTKATSARRLVDGDKRVGKVIRALWEMGPDRINPSVMELATMNLNRVEMRNLWRAALRVPQWLGRHTNHVWPSCKTKT